MRLLSRLFRRQKPIRTSPQSSRTCGLALLALGVVFGDIGTSPLYALRECFLGPHAVQASKENVLGIVSLILWTIILIVSVKYIIVVLRADNRGEGGILALMALVGHGKKDGRIIRPWILTLGILGAALLFGDGIITPAISVLSAVEGLTIAAPPFRSYVIPVSVGILAGLFVVQSRGTAKIGSLFGPVMLLWFLVIGLLGILAIAGAPSILAAANPRFAVQFIASNGLYSFASLGSVFLAVTGAEVLYADLGHFGRKPIRAAWFCAALPGLLLNYFGQGAFLLHSPQMADNLFYRIVPPGLLYPMVALATTATIIASQAVISGAFSLSKQSVALGLWPRVLIRHTSTKEFGQVYVPFMNWCLFFGTLALIFFFKESGQLAGAYGIAVSGTMVITTVLIIVAARQRWAIRWRFLFPIAALFLVIDCCFLFSNILKIGTGGWVVVIIAGIAFVSFKTWINGREILRKRIAEDSMSIGALAQSIAQMGPHRVPRTAVFLTANPNGVPGALLHNLKHNMVLHERTMIVTVKTLKIPYVPDAEKAEVKPVGPGICRIILRFGFCETPNIPAALGRIPDCGGPLEIEKTSFFLGRESLVLGKQRTMPMWRKRIFEFMSRNSLDASSFYKLPPNRVVELGSRIEL